MISLLGKKTEAEKGVSAKQKNTPKRLQLPRTRLLPTACVGGTRESRTRSGVLGGDSSISVRKGASHAGGKEPTRTSRQQDRDPEMMQQSDNTLMH